MQNDDQQFEDSLREFWPVAPRALPELSNTNQRNWRRLAAAAVLLIASGGALWLMEIPRETRRISAAQNSPTPKGDSRPQTTTPKLALARTELERLAVENPAEFDAALFAVSKNSLPRFTGPTSLLRVLAQD